jgi:hypothetical protein
MNQHPYLRAYMAGIVVPTCVVLIAFTVFCAARFVWHVPFPIERIIIFPMALVPNAFGAWNMFYLALRNHPHLPIGFHGALLPLILAPCGLLIASGLGFASLGPEGILWFDSIKIYYAHVAIVLLIGLIVYYLVWKYLVGSLNEFMGIGG